VPEAIRKATEAAKRDMIFVPLRSGRTLHHDVNGRHGAGKVLLRSAKAGTGIIAGGPMRAVFETLGVQDVVAKSTWFVEPLQHGSCDVRCSEASDASEGHRCTARHQVLPPFRLAAHDVVASEE
jgi:hypothetical protein